MRVFLTGGGGLVGRHLVPALVERGDQPVVLTRSPEKVRRRLPETVEVVGGDPTEQGSWQEAVAGCQAAVNLAGEPVGARRWNAQVRQQILDSRVDATRLLALAIGRAGEERRPRVLVSASGMDYYPFAIDATGAGFDDDEVTESDPPGETYFARVCQRWEAEAEEAVKHGARVVVTRFGIILSPEAEAVRRMAMPFRFFAGGPLGRGLQWMSWVHIDDVVRAILFAIDRDDLAGPVNVCAPQTIRNRDFSAAMGRVLGRPSWLPAPAFAVKFVAGEFADYALNGRRAVPARLAEAGFEFRFPEIEPALRNVLAATPGR